MGERKQDGEMLYEIWPEKLVWSDRTPDKAVSDSALPRWRASGVSTWNAENMTASTRDEKLGESSANKNYGTAFGKKNCSGPLTLVVISSELVLANTEKPEMIPPPDTLMKMLFVIPIHYSEGRKVFGSKGNLFIAEEKLDHSQLRNHLPSNRCFGET